MLEGLMMTRQLSIPAVLEHAARSRPEGQIVSIGADGQRRRFTFTEIRRRVHRLAHALVRLGIRPGDRVATLAFNSNRHLELYYAIAGVGAVCHTINPRLFPDQIEWIANHAKDRLLFFDTPLAGLVGGLNDRLPAGMGYVALSDGGPLPPEVPAGCLDYEGLLAAETGAGDFDWPDLPETTACALCYTSGTTGNPKGVLFSHRSQILHSFTTLISALPLFGHDKVMMAVVPLFHVNAWGLPYTCLLSGTSMVMPGPRLDGASVFTAMDEEGVTGSFGVPTVWTGLIEEMRRRGRKPARLTETLVGGSALTEPIMRAMEAEFGIRMGHGWGMTETSPLATFCVPDLAWASDPAPARKLRQGGPIFGIDIKIEGEQGETLPHDGQSRGDLLVRGPWVASAYYNNPEASAAAVSDGWFRTGDVAVIHPDGDMEIVDRTKDLIKSGGEWISSLELEAAALACPGVATVAAIAVPHPKWSERPLLCAVLRPGATVTAEDILAEVATRMAKWQVPDDVVFVDALPMTATGKVSKLQLRERFRGFYEG